MRTAKQPAKSAALLMLLTVLAGCAAGAGGGSSQSAAPPVLGPAVGVPATSPQGGLPPLTGPKKRIAVAKFDAAGAFMAHYGGWDIGGGLAAQLTTALVNSGHFIVVERAELSPVLREADMAMQKIVSKETAAQVGRILGAQLLVAGSVTEFDQRAGGGRLRLGGATGVFGGALMGESINGVVGMDVRVIDTTTGQVVQSHRVEATTSQRGISADINVEQVIFGGDAFNKTVLGQATRQAIEQAVMFIIRSTEQTAWTGRVVEVAGKQVYINAGASAGVKPGDRFTVTAVVRELTDPESGAILGIVEDRRGEIEVVSVQEKFSVAKPRTPFQATRGDLVKLSGR
ncbi:CsgG/HfaB family protein [Candidatus Methylomirabilis sp.]|uniref:CsgG/HfaB family protein n=1 Tax=Candidatus Methylomirabilis sp. TaxID=2032687 RepID=UPI0030763F05